MEDGAKEESISIRSHKPMEITSVGTKRNQWGTEVVFTGNWEGDRDGTFLRKKR